MLINRNLFNEVKYVAPSESHTLCAECTDEVFIIGVLSFVYPKDRNESEEDYQNRLFDEMDSYPLIGVIPNDSLLCQALLKWVHTGHHTKLIDPIDYQVGAPCPDDHQLYFLTRDTNYDVIDVDLFGGNDSGEKKQKFVDFVNESL